MFRTRDFVLVFTSVVFLVMAIGVTVFAQWQGTETDKNMLRPAAVVNDDYLVESKNSHEFSREEKLQQMRDKIAASSELSITSPIPEEVSQEIQATTTNEEGVGTASELSLCANYAPFLGFWSAADLEIEEAEGARVVYRTTAPQAAPAPVVGTSSRPTPVVAEREIVAQLPIRNFPAPSSSCIASDVIGIATDGSLIRNTEAGVYGIFNSSTLVGWALDGFPIYGSSAIPADACGGIMAAEGYRYQISPDRATILNCFSSTPINL
jgi:hypothetical protein